MHHADIGYRPVMLGLSVLLPSGESRLLAFHLVSSAYSVIDVSSSSSTTYGSLDNIVYVIWACLGTALFEGFVLG